MAKLRLGLCFVGRWIGRWRVRVPLRMDVEHGVLEYISHLVQVRFQCLQMVGGHVKPLQ